MEADKLRELVQWHAEYRPEWDSTPDSYAEHGVVAWGKSRRLGMLRLGAVKAYIGVQHVDPARPGWAVVDEPCARFFLSLFINGRVVTLRTYPTMEAVMEGLGQFVQGVDKRSLGLL